MGYSRTNTLWVGESSHSNDDGEIVVSEQNKSAILLPILSLGKF